MRAGGEWEYERPGSMDNVIFYAFQGEATLNGATAIRAQQVSAPWPLPSALCSADGLGWLRVGWVRCAASTRRRAPPPPSRPYENPTPVRPFCGAEAMACDGVGVQGGSGFRALVFTGKQTREKLVWHGPFVCADKQQLMGCFSQVSGTALLLSLLLLLLLPLPPLLLLLHAAHGHASGPPACLWSAFDDAAGSCSCCCFCSRSGCR